MKTLFAMMLLTAMTDFGAGWDSVTQISEGQKIELKTRDGVKLQGTLISATAESIAIRYESGERSIDRADVLRVRVYDAGRRTRLGIIGTTVGALAGLGIGFVVCPHCPNEGAGAKYIGPGVGIGAGLGTLGFFSSPYKTVYEVK